MDKKLLKPIIFLIVLVTLYFMNNYFQNRYSSKLSSFFHINENETSKIIISSKEDAIDYAKKNKINYILVEPNKRSIVKKSYADNFLK